MELTEEAFKKVNIQEFKIHLTDNEDHHAAVLSKKSASKREYTVIIPKTDTMGQDLISAHAVIQKRKGSPVTTWWPSLS
jgi:hypothetical protein